jgi:methylation protein EvaC
MPLGDGFLSAEDFSDEYFFHLEAALCQGCGMVQLSEAVSRERMFHADYAFFSSTSSRMVAHFERFAGDIVAQIARPAPFIVEIGCNDGSMLAAFAGAGVRHLGVDPADNVVQAARRRGLDVTCEFFEEATAQRIAKSHGLADVIVATNCMCHIPYMDSVLAGVRTLLKDDGLFVFEDPYLGDIVESGAFDQFYDEHVFYFSIAGVENMVQRHGLELVDARRQPVHGGSMRYFVGPKGARPPSQELEILRDQESVRGLRRFETYEVFRRRAEHVRETLPALLRDLRSSGKRVVGYAATAKSATLLNYAGIGTDLVPFICDTTPTKHGRYSPGVHIPIRPYEDFARPYPDYAVLFAWNHADEILAKERAFTAQGGRFIVYVPEVRVL